MTPAQGRGGGGATDLAPPSVAVPDSLDGWVSRLELAESAMAAPLAHVPQTATTLVVRGEPGGRTDVAVVGPQTRATYARGGDDATRCAWIRLSAGAVPTLLGIDASDLTDGEARLADLPGPAARLAEMLRHTAPEDAPRLLADVLQPPHETRAERARRDMLRVAVGALAAGMPVGELPDLLGLGERRLRTLFGTGIGVSPKHVYRIERLRRVLARAGHMPWAALAADAGYYDQSHLATDFRRMMGVPPAAFVRGVRPAATCRSGR